MLDCLFDGCYILLEEVVQEYNTRKFLSDIQKFSAERTISLQEKLWSLKLLCNDGRLALGLSKKQ